MTKVISALLTLVWLGMGIYLVALTARFVTAVESIAHDVRKVADKSE